MQPLPQFQLHHDVRAPQVDARSFRQGWRVHTRLDGLLDDRLIEPCHWQAACTYRTAWDRTLAVPGAWAAWAASRTSGGTGDAHSRLAALVRIQGVLRWVEEAMEAREVTLCRLCVVEDRSWRSIGGLLHISHHTARRWAASAIVVLAARMEAPRVGPSRSPHVLRSNNLAGCAQ